MVRETRIVFEVKDILAFKVQCKKCNNEVSVHLDSDQVIPDDCPMCHKGSWMVGTGAYSLLKALRSALEEQPSTGATIHLEVDGEQESQNK